jgi:hypothetical protein
LYAAAATKYEPNWERSQRSIRAAASVARTGSRRSSTHQSTRSPTSRAVPAMNCHIPTAEERETA